jgi:hypothetical protein
MGVLFFYISLIASYFMIYPINNYPQPTSLQTISNNLNTEINSLRLLIKTKDDNLKNLSKFNKYNKLNYYYDYYY